MRSVLETIAANPKQRNGKTLMKRFAEMHFDNCPAGEQGRESDGRNQFVLLASIIQKRTK